MSSKYTTEYKKKMATRIMRLKKESDQLHVLEIIQKHENKAIREADENILMFFHDYSEETYHRIDKFLRRIHKKNKENTMTDTAITTDTDYIPYTQDEFTSQSVHSPKLKYSNKEKNLIKRRRYDMELSKENGSEVIYHRFDVNTMTESEFSESRIHRLSGSEKQEPGNNLTSVEEPKQKKKSRTTKPKTKDAKPKTKDAKPKTRSTKQKKEKG